jgi:hypothetical protein
MQEDGLIHNLTHALQEPVNLLVLQTRSLRDFSIGNTILLHLPKLGFAEAANRQGVVVPCLHLNQTKLIGVIVAIGNIHDRAVEITEDGQGSRSRDTAISAVCEPIAPRR